MRMWLGLICLLVAPPAAAQTPPSPAELQAYRGLHAAAATGDVAAIEKLAASGMALEARDANGRTPLHVAAFARQSGSARALMRLGADANALEAQRYDIVTIAAVADDVAMLKAALAGGCRSGNVTSPYDGTALIAAAHLGHDEVVRVLITAKAPLDHVNNLGWTALIESIVLGDGGRRHVATLKALVEAGANVTIADRGGATPLMLAKRRGFTEMVAILEKAGAR
jgi:ankyrin repeat protein